MPILDRYLGYTILQYTLITMLVLLGLSLGACATRPPPRSH